MIFKFLYFLMWDLERETSFFKQSQYISGLLHGFEDMIGTSGYFPFDF